MTLKRSLNSDELSVEKKKKKKVEEQKKINTEDVEKDIEIEKEKTQEIEIKEVKKSTDIEKENEIEKEKERNDVEDKNQTNNSDDVFENIEQNDISDTDSLRSSNKSSKCSKEKNPRKRNNEIEVETEKKKENIENINKDTDMEEDNQEKIKETMIKVENIENKKEKNTPNTNKNEDVSEKTKENKEQQENSMTDSKGTLLKDTKEKGKKQGEKTAEETSTNMYQNTCYNMYMNHTNSGYNYMNFPYDVEQYYNMTTTTSLNDSSKETTTTTTKQANNPEENNKDNNSKIKNDKSNGIDETEKSKKENIEKVNEKGVEPPGTKDKNEITQGINANLMVNSNVQNMMTTMTNNVTNFYVNGLTGTNPYAASMNTNNQYTNQMCMNQMNYGMNNTMNGYYMYNYINPLNDMNYNYYYPYDGKSYGTDYSKNNETPVQPYDYRNAIDKSLEAMKRNNRAKEIIKHPARLQVNAEELNKAEYTEGNDQYNIWFGKYVNDRFDKSAKNIPRFVAKYKCNPLKDSGYTRADKVYSSSKQYFCIYFARGCCAYGSNCLYRHRVPNENDELEFENSVDIFGREKFSTHREDMSGVGCFNNESRTLFIGSIYINDAADASAIEKILYDEFSPFGNIDYIRFIPHKNIAFIQFTNRVNAEFAKVAMSDQPIENHSTALTIKWAYEMKSMPNTNVPLQYYNSPYMYNNQMISSTWTNYIMQQQQQQPPQPPQPPQLPQSQSQSQSQSLQTSQLSPPPPQLPTQLSQYHTAYYGDYNQLYANLNKKSQDKHVNVSNMNNSNFIQVDKVYDSQGKGGKR